MTSEKAFFHYLRKNSQSLYHIAKENKKEKKILAQAITEKDKNTITQILENTVSKKESKTYSKGDCIDEVLDYAIDKYDHLRDIRTVVHFEDLASNLINEKEYHLAEQLHYLKILFQTIGLKESTMNSLWEKEAKECYNRITLFIDNYYIQKITK